MTSMPTEQTDFSVKPQTQTGQLEFQRGLAAASILATDSPDAIQQALIHLQTVSQASRVYVFENFVDETDGLCIRQTTEACAPDVKPEIDNPEMQHLPYDAFAPHWPEKLSQGQYISNIVANMSQAEREVFEEQSILAILIIPIYTDEKWYGFIGFDNTATAEKWDDTSIEVLRTTATLIGSHLTRKQQQQTLEGRVAQNELALERYTAQQQSLIESMPDPVVIYNATGEVEYLNPTFTEVFGWSWEELHGKRIEFVPNNRIEELPVMLEELNKSGRINGFETERSTKSGEVLTITLSVSALYNEKQGYDGSIVILRDITARKQAEAELMAYQERLEEMVDERSREVKESADQATGLLSAVPDLMFQFNADGVFIDYKTAHNQELIMPPEAFMGKKVNEVLPPEIANQALNAIQNVIETNETQEFEYQAPIENELRSFEARFAASGRNTVLMLARDITERRQADDQLKYQAELLDNISDAIISSDLNFVVRTWNKASERLYGYTAAETVGRSAIEFVQTQYLEHSNDEVVQMLLTTGSYSGKAQQTTANGRAYTVMASLNTIRDNTGNPIGFTASNYNITQQEEIEMERRRLTAILENSTDYIAIADLSGQIIYQNKAGFNMLGHSLEDGPLHIKDILTPPSLKLIQQTVTPMLRRGQGETWLGETEAQTKDGQILPMSQLIIAHHDEKGDLQYISTVARDITDQKVAEAERQRLNDIIENTSDFVALLDEEHNIIFLNNAGQQIVGRKFDREAKLNIADIIPGHMVPLIFDQALPHTQEQGQWAGDAFLQHQDGTEIPVSQVLTAHKNDVGEISYYAIMARDITSQKALSEQVQTSLQRRSLQVTLTNTLAQQISAATDLNEIYARVINLIQEEFALYHIQIMQYSESLNTLVPVMGHGEVGRRIAESGETAPIDRGLIGLAFATKKSVLRPDVKKDPDWQPYHMLPDTRGELVVPILFQDQVFGMIDAQSNQVNQLTEEERVIFEGLSGQIAIAIENTRLRQDMEGRLEELNNLQRLMSREGWEQYGARSGTTQKGYLFDQDTIQPLGFGESTNGQPAAPALNLSTTQASPLVVNAITVRGESIGTLGIEDSVDHPLTDDERELLHEISQQVGEALETARLLEQTHKRALELETVAQVSATTATILQRDQLLQSVATLAKDSFNLYHANIYLVDSESEELRLAAGSGGIGELLIAEEWRIHKEEQTLPARVVQTGEGHINNDVFNDPTYIPNPFLPQTRSKLAVPMIAAGETMGVLELHADHPHSFSREDLQIHSTLATQTAIALQNAELFQEQLETAEKLREVDRLKSEFLASMSHELRTPLNSIIGFADVLLEGIDGELNERMEEDVMLIRDGGQHLRELIGDILDMAKMEAGMMELSYGKVDLGRVAHEVMAMISSLLQDKPVHLIDNIEEEIGYIQADRTRLIQIFLNILSNAAKFTDRGSITLTIKRQHDFDVLVSVSDTGDGIKEEDIPMVFTQFSQVGGIQHRKAGGTGLGMPITKQLVELHGGKIWLESVFGMGTTFYFTIPHEPPVQKVETKGYYA